MAPKSNPARRGTRVLGGEEQATRTGDRPWWRGTALAGGVFTALLVLAVALNLTGSGGTGAQSGGASPARTGQQSTAPTQGTSDAGGDASTSDQRLVDGVPVGYPHTEAGAVRAAVNYQIARSSAKYFTDASIRHKIINAMAAMESRNALTRNDDNAMKQVLISLGANDSNADALVARGAAMGTKTDSYSEQVATVEVWMAGLVGTTDKSAPLPVSASWTTCTLTLQWQGSDWKLASVSSVNGPTPLDTGSDNPTSVDAFRSADEEFHAPPYAG